MGIPSFYKHLIQTIGGLTSDTRPPPKVFALDLNCAIYHCVRKVQRRFPFNPDVQEKWEKDLIDTVIAYIKDINTIVNPSKTLYIGVDGVAPMAKIKQQRMRRFKSAIQAEEEARIKAEAKGHVYVELPRWDTNAITPGTRFMEKLTVALRDYAKTSPKIVVSPADEPGEGEQKIMAWVRAQKSDDVVVYGLDADLIVLSLWAHATLGIRMDLFREETEFNGMIKEDALGQTQYLYLNIQQLAQALHSKYGKGQTKSAFLVDFVGLMNILGNDFVCHGLGLKIKDDGVEKLLGIQGTEPLVINDGVWRYNTTALKHIFKTLAPQEPAWILKNIRKKLEARVGSTASKNPEDQALARFNDLPVEWAADRVMIESAGDDKPQLKAGWRQIYDKEALLGPTAPQVYLQSLAWTLAYYSGQPVDMEWYYPWFLPPRMESILEVLETQDRLDVPNTLRPVLKPLEQLAMVLPKSSFCLLPIEYRRLDTQYPHAWPVSWKTYSFGRRFLWECEPLIPLVQADQIRAWTKGG
jgi:5'-3' exonuclease